MLRLLAMLTVCLVALFIQANGASIRRGIGDGDDGGMAGLGGALAGMLGGGGGGGGDDDDDPNMVGDKKKKKASGASGVDLGGMENSLKSGGIGGLMGMLTAMRAAQGNQDNHIVKGKNGEDMYDFRDLDDGTTTAMPTITMAPVMTLAPSMTGVAVPDAPKISLPGKGGKVAGIDAAAAQIKAQDAANAALAKSAQATPASQLVVWPPKAPATQPAVQNLPVTMQATPLAVQPPMFAGASVAPALQVIAPPTAPMMVPASGTSPNGFYQQLAAMRQNMDTLLGEAASMGLGSGAAPAGVGVSGGVDGSLAVKLDQLSQNFATEEKTLEEKIDSLEGENKDMKNQLAKNAAEIKTLEAQSPSSRSKASGGFLQDEKHTNQAFRYGGIATIFHRKQKIAS